MWRHGELPEDELKPKVRFSLPALSTNRNQPPQGDGVLMLRHDGGRVLTAAAPQFPFFTHDTVIHLGARFMEINQWQALISESIGRVDQEVTALEQLKEISEAYLQDQHLYSQHMRDCVALSNTAGPAGLRQNYVFIELRKEERLANELRELTQNQIGVLLHNASTLMEVRALLRADFQDKDEAVQLTRKCINLNLKAESVQLPVSGNRPNQLTHDKWLSHCRELRLAADRLIKNSTSFRGNLRLALNNGKNTQKHQFCATDAAMRRKTNSLIRVQETLLWQKEQIDEEISSLRTNIQRLLNQIWSCDSKLQHAINRLEILNRRPRQELCLDQPCVALALEQLDLTKVATRLRPALVHAQQTLELTYRRLRILEATLAKNAQALNLEQQCQNLYQSFVHMPITTVVFTNESAEPRGVTEYK